MTNILLILNAEVLDVPNLHIFPLQMDRLQADANDLQIRGGMMLQVIEDQFVLRCVRFETNQAEESLIFVLREAQNFLQCVCLDVQAPRMPSVVDLTTEVAAAGRTLVRSSFTITQ